MFPTEREVCYMLLENLLWDFPWTVPRTSQECSLQPTLSCKLCWAIPPDPAAVKGVSTERQIKKISELPQKKINKSKAISRYGKIRNINGSICSKCGVANAAKLRLGPGSGKGWLSSGRQIICLRFVFGNMQQDWTLQLVCQLKKYPSWRVSVSSWIFWFVLLSNDGSPSVSRPSSQICGWTCKPCMKTKPSKRAFWASAGGGGPHSKLARVAGPPTASQQRRQRQSCWEAKVHA